MECQWDLLGAREKQLGLVGLLFLFSQNMKGKAPMASNEHNFSMVLGITLFPALDLNETLSRKKPYDMQISNRIIPIGFVYQAKRFAMGNDFYYIAEKPDGTRSEYLKESTAVSWLQIEAMTR